jgi:hypothetical protein
MLVGVRTDSIQEIEKMEFKKENQSGIVPHRNNVSHGGTMEAVDPRLKANSGCCSAEFAAECAVHAVHSSISSTNGPTLEII